MLHLRLGACLLFVLALGLPALASAGNAAPCKGRGTSVVVDLDDSDLWLCEQGKAKERYRVALGSGGIDKRKQGDKKTPTGSYVLGPGRGSSKFHLFLDVGYPTKKQRAKGYTGSAIGIHGPKRGFTWLGFLNSVIDWTQGCIAVATDREIEAIDAWVRAKKARKVHLISE